MGTAASRRKRALEKERLKTFGVKRKRERKTTKVLVLGAHQSGKSTFCRGVTLMDRITNSTMDRQQADDYLERYKSAVPQHTWRVLQAVAAHLEDADFELKPLADASAEELAATLSLLKSPRIAEALELAKLEPATATLMITAQHFIDRAPFILSEDFEIPSLSDVMWVSFATTGFIEYSIAICTEERGQTNPLRLQLVEMGGLRNERKKWIHAFESVDCVVFTLDVSDCVRASVLFEDSSTDRWHEAIALLGVILNNQYFESASFRIVLTKCDWLFANYAADEKLEVARIRDSDGRPPPMTASQCLRYLTKQLPTLCVDERTRKRVRVVAVNCMSLKMDALFDLATIYGFDFGDSLETVMAKERKRRIHLLSGALKEWTVELPIWETLDTSDLRRLIEAFAFTHLGDFPSQTDPRLESLKEPWQVLRQVTTDLLAPPLKVGTDDLLHC